MRRVLVVVGGGRSTGDSVRPLLERLADDHCSVVLAASSRAPLPVLESDDVTVVSLRPRRWQPRTGPGPVVTPPSAAAASLPKKVLRRLGTYLPSYPAGRRTWTRVRRHGGVLEAAQHADMIVAVNPEAVLAVWQLGRLNTRCQIVFGLSGVEAVLDRWRRGE
jgi:hypothetical protein